MKIFTFALLLGSLIRDARAEDFLAEILSGDLDSLKDGKSQSTETSQVRPINSNEMNRRIRQKVAGGYFSEATYKECIADELNRAGYKPLEISTKLWNLEYELKSAPEENQFVALEIFSREKDSVPIIMSVPLMETSQIIPLETASAFRINYNLTGASMSVFRKFALYPVTDDNEETDSFRLQSLLKYAHCTEIRPIVSLKGLRVGCEDIETGFFEFPAIRLGRASPFSNECFRKWDGNVMRIGKLQVYPQDHCGSNAVKFALETCADPSSYGCYNGFRILEQACDCQGKSRLPYELLQPTNLMLNVDYYFRGEYKISTIFKPEKTWDANMAYDLSVSNVEFDSIEVKPVESNSKTTVCQPMKFLRLQMVTNNGRINPIKPIQCPELDWSLNCEPSPYLDDVCVREKELSLTYDETKNSFENSPLGSLWGNSARPVESQIAERLYSRNNQAQKKKNQNAKSRTRAKDTPNRKPVTENPEEARTGSAEVDREGKRNNLAPAQRVQRGGRGRKHRKQTTTVEPEVRETTEDPLAAFFKNVIGTKPETTTTTTTTTTSRSSTTQTTTTASSTTASTTSTKTTTTTSTTPQTTTTTSTTTRRKTTPSTSTTATTTTTTTTTTTATTTTTTRTTTTTTSTTTTSTSTTTTTTSTTTSTTPAPTTTTTATTTSSMPDPTTTTSAISEIETSTEIFNEDYFLFSQEFEEEVESEFSQSGMLMDVHYFENNEDELEYEDEEYEEQEDNENEFESESVEYDSENESDGSSYSQISESENESSFMQMDVSLPAEDESEFPESLEPSDYDETEEIEEEESEESEDADSASFVQSQEDSRDYSEETEEEHDENNSEEEDLPMLLDIPSLDIIPESEEEAVEIAEFQEAEQQARSLSLGLVPRNLASFGCTHCFAHNMTECLNSGTYSPCQENEVCQIEVRKRNGDVRWVGMRCKSIEACYDNKAQNFIGKLADRQCRPTSTKSPSVCRQCCATDRCTDNFNPLTQTGWRMELIN